MIRTENAHLPQIKYINHYRVCLMSLKSLPVKYGKMIFHLA